jgi:hypothetical protein
MSDTNKIENIFNDNNLNSSIEELIELDIKYFIISFINICKFYIIEPLKQNAIKSELDKNNLISKLDALLGYNSKYKSKLGEETYSSMNVILEGLRLNITSKPLESSTSESKTEMDSTLKQQIITTAITGVEKYIREKGSVSENKPIEQAGFPETKGTEPPTNIGTIPQPAIQIGEPKIINRSEEKFEEDPEFAETGISTLTERSLSENNLSNIIERGSATAETEQPENIEELNLWGLQQAEEAKILEGLRTSKERPNSENNLSKNIERGSATAEIDQGVPETIEGLNLWTSRQAEAENLEEENANEVKPESALKQESVSAGAVAEGQVLETYQPIQAETKK